MQQTNTAGTSFKDRVNGNIKIVWKEYLFQTIASSLAFAAGWFGVKFIFFLVDNDLRHLYDTWYVVATYCVVLCLMMPLMYCMAVRSLKFVDIEDAGDHLLVTAGPGTCLCRVDKMHEKISYDNIESFGKPDWDTNKNYHYGNRILPKESLRIWSIFPGDSTRKGDEIAIVLKEAFVPPGCGGKNWQYRTLLICVNDYKATEALLESKCAANTSRAEGASQVTLDL